MSYLLLQCSSVQKNISYRKLRYVLRGLELKWKLQPTLEGKDKMRRRVFAAGVAFYRRLTTYACPRRLSRDPA